MTFLATCRSGDNTDFLFAQLFFRIFEQCARSVGNAIVDGKKFRIRPDKSPGIYGMRHGFHVSFLYGFNQPRGDLEFRGDIFCRQPLMDTPLTKQGSKVCQRQNSFRLFHAVYLSEIECKKG